MKIEKKIWPKYFKEISAGKKNFELRLNDFEVGEGDTLLLREWDPGTNDYTGNEIEKEVTHVAKIKMDNLIKFWSREEIEEKGIQIISIK